MNFSLITDRLLIAPMKIDDHDFIMALVNSPGWIQFIGQRNIGNSDQAKAYIQKVLDNPQIHYWVVRKRNDQTPMGLVTLVKRDYLDYHDIGFAFLPFFSGQGYAYESTLGFMNHILKNSDHKIFQASTLPANISSIKLLEKLGFVFEKEIAAPPKNEKISVFKYTI